jgi:ATP-dependent DNA ligase
MAAAEKNASFHGVMLAEEYKDWPKGVEHLLAEPKLDGYRCAVVIVNGVASVHCRDAAPVLWGNNLGHIVDELLELGFDNCMVDGEVMADDWGKTGIIKKGCSAKNGYVRPSDEVMAEIRRTVRHYVFDWVDLTQVHIVDALVGTKRKNVPCFGMSLRDRRAELQKYLRGSEMTGIVRLVPQTRVTAGDVPEAAAKALLDGYEGIMLKHPMSVYNFVRSTALLKVKPWKTIDARIVGTVEGLPSENMVTLEDGTQVPERGKFQGSLGALSCVLEDGTEVSVGGGRGLTTALRNELWARRDSLVGQWIEVKVQEGDVASARHPQYLRFKLDRDDTHG